MEATSENYCRVRPAGLLTSPGQHVECFYPVVIPEVVASDDGGISLGGDAEGNSEKLDIEAVHF